MNVPQSKHPAPSMALHPPDPVTRPRPSTMRLVADSPIDDEALARRLRQGDRAAFASLVQQHQRTVFALAWRYVRIEEDAKDVTQAVFVKAWQGAAQFRGDSTLRTWLCRIAVHLSLNWLRDHGKVRSVALQEDMLPTTGPRALELDEAETAAQLHSAVATLPEKQRMAVELRVHEGLSFREIGDIAGCSEDAAKANFHHGLKKLKGLLRPMPQ